MNRAKNIKDLLDRFFDGDTTLKEEDTLRSFFNEKNIDPSLLKYRSLFNYYSEERDKIFKHQANTPKINTPLVIRRVSYFAAAAAVIAMFFILFEKELSTKETIELTLDGVKIENCDAAISLAQINLDKLNAISTKIDSGNESLDDLQRIK